MLPKCTKCHKDMPLFEKDFNLKDDNTVRFYFHFMCMSCSMSKKTVLDLEIPQGKEKEEKKIRMEKKEGRD